MCVVFGVHLQCFYLHLPLTRNAVFVNVVLVFTLHFFINVQGGFRKAVCKCKALLRNFLWAGVNMQGLRAKVNWGEFCIHHLRGLSLIAAKEGLVALLCKWVLKALELGDLNLKIMLQYLLRNLKCKLSKHAMWILHLNWALIYNHVSPFGKHKI